HQQSRHDREAHDREHDWVEHGAEDSLAQQLAVLRIGGESLEDRIEIARLLARGDRRAVDLWKYPWDLREAPCESMTFHDARTRAQDDALHPGLFSLLRYREQRLLERQPRAHQGCKLAREERQIGWGDAPAPAEGTLLFGLALRDHRDRHRQPL